MPNFPPLRRYVFSIVDRWTARHGLASPFLEVGCGTGELAVRLARRGWEGTVVDSSPEALARARASLESFPGVRVADGGLEGVVAGGFRTAFLMDVVEHVEDDEGLLRKMASKLATDGFLVLLTPVNPSAWGRDDELYGHCRRYGWKELEGKLEAAGFTVVTHWNVTVPFIWLLRRLYLRALPSGAGSSRRDALTASSSFFNPWSERLLLRAAGAVLGLPLWWIPLFLVQDLFAGSRWGHAAMFLARKEGA